MSHRDEIVTAIVESDGCRDGRRWVERWQLILRPQADVNGRPAGYRVWLRRGAELPETEQAAIDGACRLIEQITGAIDPPDWARPA